MIATKQIMILVFNSSLLAAGIILILIPCIQYGNWWPLLTIFVHFFAVIFPVMCGGCSFGSDNWSYSGGDETLAMVSWLLVGIFVVLGYAMPAILLRGGMIPKTGLILSFAGGTTILLSILFFVRVVYFTESD